MTLPKIKHVRAWFIGGATAEQGAGGGDYHDQGDNHWIDDHIATPMSKYKQLSSPGSRLASTCWGR